jgi:flagellar hook-associated protein 2
MAVTGVGSGAIDVGSIVSQLMSIERQPLAKMKQDLSGLQTKLSAWGKMQAAVSTLRDATKVLTQSSTWQASKAGSSDEASVMAVGGGTAAAGTYSLSVQSLAQRHSVVSRTVPGRRHRVVGGGSLQIQLGSVNADGVAFDARLETANDVPIAGRCDARRNPQRHQQRQRRSLRIHPDDGDGKRLVLTSKESGRHRLRDHAHRRRAPDVGLCQSARHPLIGIARKQAPQTRS